MVHLTTLLAAVLLAAAPGIETTPIPLAVKPDFSKMMIGKWTCSTKSSRRPAPFITTNDATVGADGYWLVDRFTIHKTSWSPQRTGEDRMTYDPGAKVWVDVQYDDLGGYNVSTSPGWQGNTIVWTDALAQIGHGLASTNPTTWTWVSATKRVSDMSFTLSAGRVIMVKTACAKG